MSTTTKVRQHIRANVLGYVAIFIALAIAPAWAASLRPGSVGTKQLRNGAVTSLKIRNRQVRRADLANGAVNSIKLANGQVRRADLANGAVNSAKVADDSLTGNDIDESTLAGIPVSGAAGGDLAGSYPNPTIAGGAVTSAKVANDSLTGSDIDESSLGSVPNANQLSGHPLADFLLSGADAGGDLAGTYPNPTIAAGAVGTAKLADDSVTTAKLAEHAVIGDKVAHDTLTGTNIDESTLTGVAPTGAAGGDLTGSYPNPQIAAAAIDTAELANLAVTATKLAGGAVETAKLADGAVTIPKLADLSVTTAKLAGNAVTSAKVADNSLTGSDIDESTFSTSPSGAAGGALSGNYPNPSLNVTGGPCANGQALTNISSGGALTCGFGVYRDTSANLAVAPDSVTAYGNGQTVVGRNALLFTDPAGISNNNTAFGYNALHSLDDSDVQDVEGDQKNTAIGAQALANLHNGGGNIAIGEGAGSGLAYGRHTINIGNAGTNDVVGTIRIGTSGTNTRAFIAGIRGTTTDNADAVPVVIDSAGQLGTVSSSRRFKTDIRPLGEASDALMRLRPVSFRYKQGAPELHYGLIAEQVEKVLPTLVVYGKDGRPETVQYQELPALLLAQIQRQQREIARQDAKIAWLVRQVRGR